MHTILPKISGDVVAVAALDAELAALATKMAQTVYRLDVDIGEACVGFEAAPEHTKNSLRAITPIVLEFEQETIKDLAHAARQKGEALLNTSWLFQNDKYLRQPPASG